MKALPAVAFLAVAALALAGCGAKSESQTSTGAKPALQADRGAISGLVIDDRYRPIPDAEITLLPLGKTTTSDGSGQFIFADLEPGAYEARAQVPDHEAAPTPVDVVAGEYTELELQARRIFSDSGSVITTQYSLFAPCMQSAGAVSLIDNYCLPDSSGDSYRPGLSFDFRSQGANITYVVTEILINQPDTYVFVVRCADGSSFGCGEYGYAETKGGNYGRVVIQQGADYMMTPNSIYWNNTDPVDALLFFYGTGGDTVTPVYKPVGCSAPVQPTNPLNGKPALCRDIYGVGAKFAVEAKIIMTAFVGPPPADVDVATYNVLQPK